MRLWCVFQWIRWALIDQLDVRYLTMIARHFGGGPVGIETISAGLSEPRDAIEDLIEPYMIQKGFIQRTPRGRLLMPSAWKHLGISIPHKVQNTFCGKKE